MKYKILYLTFHPEIGGGETILFTLLSSLDRNRFEPIVITLKKGQLSKKLKLANIQTHILPLSGFSIRTLFLPGMSLSGIYKCFKLAQQIHPDLIHLNHLNLAIYAGITGKLLKIPVVATAHGPWDAYYFPQDLINQLFLNKILANSTQVVKQLTKENSSMLKKLKLSISE